jgi:putative transposase
LATEEKISIAAVCRQLGYSKQAYYKSKTNNAIRLCHRQIAKQKVLSVRRSMPRLGTRKLYYLLQDSFKKENLSIGRDKLFDLLREECLLVGKKRRYTKTTDSRHWMHKYPDLVKDMTITQPEQLWVADITYIPVEGGYTYLHLITDAYSKQIMGYYVSMDLAATSTMEALKMALKNRSYSTLLTHHSDRGLQYCSAAYTKLLEGNKIAISMTQDGSPYDNAVAERVNGILKDEFGLDQILMDLQVVRKQTREAISLYNNQRPHLSNNMLTPKQMHSQTHLQIKTWSKKNHKNFGGSCDFISSLQHL